MPLGGAVVSGLVGIGKTIVGANKLAQDKEELSKRQSRWRQIDPV